MKVTIHNGKYNDSIVFDIEELTEETTSCEWCEIARVCKYEVTFFEDDDR